ncbi:hypothetical protein BJ165DRAFT_1000291 [Panaeolus papilionaceus]|nr:hypothetical protein BJ165DRAFT_1000291 [Panaeolus papilionaceus]
MSSHLSHLLPPLIHSSSLLSPPNSYSLFYFSDSLALCPQVNCAALLIAPALKLILRALRAHPTTSPMCSLTLRALRAHLYYEPCALIYTMSLTCSLYNMSLYTHILRARKLIKYGFTHPLRAHKLINYGSTHPSWAYIPIMSLHTHTKPTCLPSCTSALSSSITNTCCLCLYLA